jgi:hypothetical protein
MNKHFTLVDYDVWGNEVDGWEVNTIYRTDFKIPYKKAFLKDDIIDALKECNYLKQTVTHDDVDAEWLDDTMIELTQASNYKPICRLELEEVYDDEE